MVSTSSAYKAAIKAASRDMRNLSVTVDGSTYSNSAVRSIKLTESVSDNPDRLLPGVAACASIEATVVGILSPGVIGTEMTARAGVVTSSGVEYVPLGVFVVQNIKSDPGTNLTTIVGYDRMCLLDGTDFVHERDEEASGEETTGEETTPVKISFLDLLNAVVPFNNSGVVSWANTPDVDNFFVVNRPLDELHGYNCKELLGYIAGAHGKFARFTRSGGLEFAWYEHTGITIPATSIYMDGLELRSVVDMDDTITLYSNDNLEDTGYSGVYTNDLIGSLFAETYFNVANSSASPGSLKFRGDMSLQAGDIVSVETKNGGHRNFAISEITMYFGSGFYATAECHALSQSVTHKLTATQRDISRLKKVYRIAEETTEEEGGTTEGDGTEGGTT